MPAGHEEELDAVISELIDDTSDADTGSQADANTNSGEPAGRSSPFAGIDTSKTTTGHPTVSLTERAARQVRKIKDEESLEDDLHLRVAVEGGGCSGLSYKLGFDFKTDDDQTFESQGIPIVIDPRHLMYIEGISIDFPDGLDARGFTFDNPNAEETCGCGSSFAT